MTVRRRRLSDAQFQAGMRRLLAAFERHVQEEGVAEKEERARLRGVGFIYVRTYTVKAHLRPRSKSTLR